MSIAKAYDGAGALLDLGEGTGGDSRPRDVR
jgi:hypothetical protein